MKQKKPAVHCGPKQPNLIIEYAFVLFLVQLTYKVYTSFARINPCSVGTTYS